MNRACHTRRSLLEAGLALGSGAQFPGWASAAPARAPFLVGANLPWITYGHDFGSNAWGHDGMSTAGWTRQTRHDSVGFTAVRRCAELGPSRKPSICITAELNGTIRERRSGEVFIDLANHAPRGHTAPLRLTGARIEAWVRVPPGAAGQPSASNGVQLFAKSVGWHSCYSRWHNIHAGWEGQWRRVEFDLGGMVAHRDRGFDDSRAIAIGFKLGINSASSAKLAGEVMLSDLRVTGNPPLEFDLGATEIERDLRALRNVFEDCPRPVARVFVFADGRASPEFDAHGAVTGLDPEFSADFDALLAAAQAQQFALMPVLRKR